MVTKRRSHKAPLLPLPWMALAALTAGILFLSSQRLVWAAPPESSEEAPEAKHEALYKWINFALLAGGLGFVLRKPLREFFLQRSSSIRKSLEEGRQALKASQAQLRLVEDKLARLDEEIRTFKSSTAREIEAERERMRKETREEAEKILQSARALIESATRAARLELRNFTVQQAIQLAEQMIRQRLDDSKRQRLIRQFAQGLSETQRPRVGN